MIRVLIADSQSDDVDALMAILSSDPEIEVVGVAATRSQLIGLVSDLRPDIVAMSDILEGLDSAEVIERIMAYYPTPILVLTCPGHEGGDKSVFRAISMGALDVMEKPTIQARHAMPIQSPVSRKIVETVRLLSRIKVVTHLAGKIGKKTVGQSHHNPDRSEREPIKLVAIAASTGGPSALAEILRNLPSGLGMGAVIVQHVAEGFSIGLAEWLDKESQMTVRVARDGDRIEPGYAFIAPGGSHMVVTDRNRIELTKTASVAGHRPSADVLFTSVAKVYTGDSIGVVLTGMGSDGAKGIAAIKRAGGKTIAQDEQSCVVFGMPQAAIQKGIVDEVLPLGSIAERIVRLCG
jgi:two-component system chemotaxis response regulator CheB